MNHVFSVAFFFAFYDVPRLITLSAIPHSSSYLGEADVGSFPIDREGDQFIIIATDGLWDVFSSEEVHFSHVSC